MIEDDIEKIKNLAGVFKRLNNKVILLSLLHKAKNAYEENNYSTCLETCEKILEADPNNPIALRGIGCVMQSTGEFEKAVEYFNKALEFSKAKEIEYTLLGNVYYNQEDLENAIKYFNLAIDANDDYDPAYEGKNQSMLENHLKIIDLQDNLIKRNIF